MSAANGRADPAEGRALIRSHLLSDLDGDDAGRVERIAGETLRAFRAPGKVRRGVAVFGSARDAPRSAWGDA